MQFNYADGAELNGIPENTLTLNVHNGTSWVSYPGTVTRDGTNNFVLTTGLAAVNLNELTLAISSTPLPLIWLSFTVTRQNQTALLQWATAQEQNTRNFVIEQSRNGINWTGIGALPAAGNSVTTSNYSYVHTTPVRGLNYYRILQTDMDNRNSYSDIKTLRFTTADETFTILVNPVTNNVLTVQVNTATGLALYTTDGKLLWQRQVNAGTKYIDVSRYAKGVYLLKANSAVQKIMIQ
ncbi:MAG: T9SS type A sorting domain-containing protein [Bacteroidota bacterium]